MWSGYLMPVANVINKRNGISDDAPVSTEEYSADGSSTVYIEIGSANYYYHKASRCNEAGFSGGTAVTLQYVKDWGYKACPYCNPPTQVGTVS